jgi:hypothetical protein
MREALMTSQSVSIITKPCMIASLMDSTDRQGLTGQREAPHRSKIRAAAELHCWDNVALVVDEGKDMSRPS